MNRDSGANPDRETALLAEYNLAVGMITTLTEVRFKLLGLLPLATVAGAALGGDPPRSTLLCSFGLLTTIGLITYNARNDQIYNELLGRVGDIERTLGLTRGAFGNRPASWLSIGGWKIDHSTGVRTIYIASTALWLHGILAPWLRAVPLLPLILSMGIPLFFDKFAEIEKKRQEGDLRSKVRGLMTAVVGNDNSDSSDFCDIDEKLEGMGLSPEEKARIAWARSETRLQKNSDPHEAASFLALVTGMPSRWIHKTYAQREEDDLVCQSLSKAGQQESLES